ncbi:hypothetical protein ABZ760_24695 [Streptomyces sp. NPDC006658]|uniref:hypothetical protein n=1 Tax=unclassified Streptomyces TaxID=2593676 RepID=UPI0033C5D130
MTTTRLHNLLHRDTRKDNRSASSLLTFSPTMHPPGGAGSAREDHAGAEPPGAETLLREFLALLEAAQEELNQRWSAQENTDCHSDRA